jgi:flagellar hook-length control protein FliK
MTLPIALAAGPDVGTAAPSVPGATADPAASAVDFLTELLRAAPSDLPTAEPGARSGAGRPDGPDRPDAPAVDQAGVAALAALVGGPVAPTAPVMSLPERPPAPLGVQTANAPLPTPHGNSPAGDAALPARGALPAAGAATAPSPAPQTATPQTATPQTATPQTATSQTATSQTATSQTATPQTATPQAATPPTTAPHPAAPHARAPHRTATGPDLAQQPTAHAHTASAQNAPAQTAPAESARTPIAQNAPHPAATDHPAGGLDPLLSAAAAAPAPAVASAHAPAAADVPPAPIVRDVEQPELAAAFGRLRSGPNGTAEITVALHPAELGAVQVRARLHNGTLDVTVACADDAALTAVTAALPSLHAHLAALGSVDVRLGDATSGQGRPPTPDESREQRHTPDRSSHDRDQGQGNPRPRRDDAEGLDRWI